MMPGQKARKREQDEARREQKADERIRELEEENERLRHLQMVLEDRLVRIAYGCEDPQFEAQEILTDVEGLDAGVGVELGTVKKENDRLREALRTVRRHVYGSRSAFQAEDADRELGHFGAPRAVKITDTDGEHPSACSYRVEAIEVVAEEIEDALDA